MAVRFDAATDQLALADAPSSTNPFSFSAWVRNIELVGFGTIMRLRAAGTVASFTASSGGSNGPQLATTGGTAGPIVGGGSGSLPADAWRRVAFVIDGSGSNNCTVYWGDDDPDTDLLTAVGTVAVGSPTALSVGGRGGGDTTERWGGDIAYARGWTAVRTAAELKAELASTAPVVTSNLWADWPLTVHTDLTDHSGNGRNLSAGSTATTTEDGPPLTVETTGTATGSGGGTGAASGTREPVGVAVGVGGGSGLAAGAREVVGSAAGVGGGTGSAVGVQEVNTFGTATGAGGGTGTATGTRERVGVGAGSAGGVGAAVGVRERVGVAAGSGGGVGLVVVVAPVSRGGSRVLERTGPVAALLERRVATARGGT